MKLIIRRNQIEKKGLLGGSKGFDFAVHFKVDLSNHEANLIDKYKVKDYVLAQFNIGDIQMGISVSNLRNGYEVTLGNVGSLLALEDEIKDACKTLKILLNVMDTFGGQEVFEI